MTAFRKAGELLGLRHEKRAVIAVIGCGGKTTFIETLARECVGKKVLVTPTTKIWPMLGKDVVLCATERECADHEPADGIQCLGVLNEKSGKLESLNPELLKSVVSRYDITLIEADGSRGLPCKGWLENEPVVPDYCTHTVGMVTLCVIGKPVCDDTVFRIDEFSNLTGLRKGETITAKAMTNMVCSEKGMFKNGHGRQSIFVNKTEDNSATAAEAERWLSDVRLTYPGRFLHLAYGNALTNEWREL